MPSWSISYCDLMNRPYFVDTTERGDRGGWKEAQRQGKDKVTLQITLLLDMHFSYFTPMLVALQCLIGSG